MTLRIDRFFNRDTLGETTESHPTFAPKGESRRPTAQSRSDDLYHLTTRADPYGASCPSYAGEKALPSSAQCAAVRMARAPTNVPVHPDDSRPMQRPG